MRYINLEELLTRISSQWEQQARSALDEVRKASPEDRSRVIDSHAKVWTQLAPLLAELSFQKCWYCESKEIRSDTPVDHFRPKNKVDKCPSHNGYWWLAFDWQNYRYSCTYCNSRRNDKVGGTSGGKQTAFPLLNEALRAYTETDDLRLEDPELLDPTRPGDPGCLWFDEDGSAVAKDTKHPVLSKRALTSIKLYHLNHTAIKEARRVLFRDVKRLIESGKIYYEQIQSGNIAAKHGFDSVNSELRGLIDKNAKYSAAARAMILGLRHPDHPWIDGIISGA